MIFLISEKIKSFTDFQANGAETPYHALILTPYHALNLSHVVFFQPISHVGTHLTETKMASLLNIVNRGVIEGTNERATAVACDLHFFWKTLSMCLSEGERRVRVTQDP